MTAATMQYIIIDCDVKPFEPNGLTVAPKSDQLPNRVRGQFVFDPAKIRIHLSTNQQGVKYILGILLKKELAGEPVFPANLLDFYLANSHLIPEEWKGKEVFFWGTIYHDSYGNLYVRSLLYFGGAYHSDYRQLVSIRWYPNYFQLVGDWRGNDPAVLRVS